MIVDVVAVWVIESFRLGLRFEDGLEGEFDFAEKVGFSGIFAALGEPEYFARVTVNPELGTVVWPNGADLDPVVLHATIEGRSIRVA